MDNQYKLSDEEHSLVFEKIKADFLNNSLSIVSPKVVITGGQPASGKGKLARDSIDQFKDKGGSVIIDPDQLRAYHPKYNELQKLDDKTSSGFTHHDAKKWSLELIEEAISHKKNIVLDQTSADFQTLKNTVQNFRDKGYKDVELKIMAVPEITSRQGIYHRYEMEKALYETGRFVNIDIHSEIYHKLENTIEQLKDEPIVDKLTVYDRHYNAIEQKDFKAERERPFSDQERQQHEYKWFKVIEAMQTRFAPYTEVEIVKGLQESDRLKLNNQKLVSEVTQVDESTGEKMDVKIVSNLTSNLLVAKDDFEKQDGYLSKNIKVDGEDNLVMFRQNRDHLELINVTKNEMMLDKPIGNHDSKQPESTALQVYMEVKEKLNNLENKILMKVDEQLSNKPKAPEVKGDSKAEVSQFQSKAPELDKHQIIKEVRIQLSKRGNWVLILLSQLMGYPLLMVTISSSMKHTVKKMVYLKPLIYLKTLKLKSQVTQLKKVKPMQQAFITIQM